MLRIRPVLSAGDTAAIGSVLSPNVAISGPSTKYDSTAPAIIKRGDARADQVADAEQFRGQLAADLRAGQADLDAVR